MKESHHLRIPHPNRLDDKALLGMPFRLMIALVTIALVVPAVMAGWSSVDYVQTEQRIRNEISRILTAAQRYFQAGSGGEQMDISLRGGAFTRVEYVRLGDNPDHGPSNLVRYKLSGGREQLITVKYPSVRMSSNDGGAITLLEGVHRIRLECLDGRGVLISVVG